MRVHPRRGIAAFVAACMVAASAYAQESAAPGTPPVSAGSTARLPTITVTAKVLRQRIDSYISKISGAYVWSDDHVKGSAKN